MLKSKLLKKIFLISCAIIIIYPLASIHLIFPSITANLIKATENEAVRTARHLESMLLSGLSDLDKGNFTGSFIEKVYKAKRDFNFSKLKIFSPKGTVLYSTAPEDIGIINDKKYFHNTVAKGENYTKVVNKNSRTLEDQIIQTDVVETYVPIIKKGEFIGAFEIYYDITHQSDQLSNIVINSTVLPLVLMFMFHAAIIFIVVKSDQKTVKEEAETLPGKYRSPFHSMFFITISIFFSELIVMLILSNFPTIPLISGAIIDATLLMILVSPVLYFFLLRPLFKYIAAQRAADKKMLHLAYYDKLTNLPNRTMFENHVHSAIQISKESNKIFALYLIDVDNFKRINDTIGHRAGDLLIKEVANRLHSLYPNSTASISKKGNEKHLLARMGGDEFALHAEISRLEDATEIARELHNVLSQSFIINNYDMSVSASMGISIYPHDGTGTIDLLRNADVALYHAKDRGKSNFQYYREALNASALMKFSLEGSLRRAIDANELILHYQPQISLKSGELCGMEALVRWEHPEKGLISPIDFIPLAEETGLIVPMGEWILHTACMQNKSWQDVGLPKVPMSVNLSSRQFQQNKLIHAVADALRTSGLPPEDLILEITESAIMQDTETTFIAVHELTSMGLRFAIDDFGTGYSSLGYLKRFPIHSIKIDKSFVMDITNNHDDAAIVKTIISMAHSLRMKVLAEGVETEPQLNFLNENGCDEIQGFYISRPLPADKFIDFCASDINKKNTPTPLPGKFINLIDKTDPGCSFSA